MSNPSPPAFDRRSRPQVSWTYDRITGKVDLVASGDGLEARITAASFAYAASITKLLLDAPPPSAFEPMPTAEQLRDPDNWAGGCMGDDGEFNGWANVAEPTTTVADATTAEPPTVPEGHPALADAEDNVGDLKAGEAV